MSRLHDNDAMLGVKTCRACAHVLCWQSALVLSGALSLSVSGGPAGPAVWHAGVGLLAACLAMAHVAVLRLSPANTRGRPSVTSYAYGLLCIALSFRHFLEILLLMSLLDITVISSIMVAIILHIHNGFTSQYLLQ